MNTCYEGTVKWFSNKAGYGFLTITKDSEVHDGESLVSEDIFVHHTGIQTTKSVYKFLAQDELVLFKIQFLENKKHKYQAYDVVSASNKFLKCEFIASNYRKRDRSTNRSNRPNTPESTPVSETSVNSEFNGSNFPELPKTEAPVPVEEEVVETETPVPVVEEEVVSTEAPVEEEVVSTEAPVEEEDVDEE